MRHGMTAAQVAVAAAKLHCAAVCRGHAASRQDAVPWRCFQRFSNGGISKTAGHAFMAAVGTASGLPQRCRAPKCPSAAATGQMCAGQKQTLNARAYVCVRKLPRQGDGAAGSENFRMCQCKFRHTTLQPCLTVAGACNKQHVKRGMPRNDEWRRLVTSESTCNTIHYASPVALEYAAAQRGAANPQWHPQC